ncbi:MAG: ATPase involved in DNA repair/AAA domain (dynein-related subfamily) [Marinobacter excellens HL-55]|uniref:ATPase involved in DNA repair/AAA domain (Dynein-related subfamily) n=1 Tax=Marinobacter excellens HL-55 TaxID=1305731 RepID=A0A0P7YH13_9GAMM|nr:MAG: ATPase involved in DNA repair/AAA domain (dynein-related subfamily) [Marinobacter excellens HL-55]
MSTDRTGLESIVQEGSAFETIQRRLKDQGAQLRQQVSGLNQAREDIFGSAGMNVLGRARVRTENNAVARDVVRLGDNLLFGFNLRLGLRKTLAIEDVFRLYHLNDGDTGFEMTEAAIDGSFLTDARFVTDFRELQQYYNTATLSQLVILKGMLLMAFRIGDKLDDLRVFRWELKADGEVGRYVDNRGERDLTFPDRFSFAWKSVGRDSQVQGRSPHLNIADTLFVDNLRGNITFKVENNTATGEGIYQDAVESDSQSLDDATFDYADLGEILLVRILPFNEKQWRYYLFNRTERKVERVDAMAGSVASLPDNHGLIFPSGYYLTTGELKTFQIPDGDFRLKRTLRSPNGEDVLYVFYEQLTGQVILFRYNLIRKQADVPLIGHGFALFENGHLVIFNADNEPTLVHPLQVWETPFTSETFHAQASVSNDSELARIGNPELVRGIAELNTVATLMEAAGASERHFTALIRTVDRVLDQFFWLTARQDEALFAGLHQQLSTIRGTAELVLDEYEKVQSIRAQTETAIAEVADAQGELMRDLKPDSWKAPDQFVGYLARLREHRGRVRTLNDRRYVDKARVEALESDLAEAEERLTDRTFRFLASPEALDGYRKTLTELQTDLVDADTRDALRKIVERYRELTSGLDMIQGMLASMAGDDAALETAITDNISGIYATINQQRSEAELRLKEQGSAEARAQFAARLRLFEQSLANGVSALTDVRECDGLMTRMLDQLQELESQFGEFDEFLAAVLEQRENAHESIEARRQQLQDQQQRRVTTLTDAAERILKNVTRRTERFASPEELHAFFASDAMVARLRSMAKELRELGAAMEADDCLGQLKAAQDNALRSVRDKADIFEDGGAVIRLGKHRFSVNQQELDLTLIPRDDHVLLHLTGTQYYERLDEPELDRLRGYWNMSQPSESDKVYRAEYLAALVIDEFRALPDLPVNVADLDELTDYIRKFASPRYREGYEKGIHDHDAALIVSTLWPATQSAGLLRFSPRARALAMLFWAELSQQPEPAQQLRSRCLSAGILSRMMQSNELLGSLEQELDPRLSEFIETHGLALTDKGSAERSLVTSAAEYLVRQLAEESDAFEITRYAGELAEGFTDALKRDNQLAQYQNALNVVAGQPKARWSITSHWLKAWMGKADQQHLQHYLPEVVAVLNAGDAVKTTVRSVELAFHVEGLLGQHACIDERTLSLQLDEFEERLRHHQQEIIPGWQQLQEVRHQVLERWRNQLRLQEFRPRPLSSFVRNKLISESYLPIIGDNLAKQMGTAGEDRRTDQSGLLMMISPPGYGKTTLMEYVAHRLGLIFMKINCPSLGHDVTSLDPEKAPHSTAEAELIKLNLALEMGNNVMLYLDDIQHTHPEFLQKFISLCDGTRRIEGVWRGRTRTYDMRGKRFCVVMAGNPYTESGEVFKVPDMLANRADIYNLGDVLSGMEHAFALSYVENSLSSNPVLAPLATRGMADFYRFADLAEGKTVADSDFEHDYSAAERDEIVALLKKMIRVRETVLRVNQAYIASSAQAEAYRTEPTFKLQGSYRNMNKLAEKLSPVMSDDELEALIDDHYQGESQLLTQGAEENLLKLKQMRGTLNEAEAARWQTICEEYRRRQQAGGDEETGVKVVRQLGLISEHMQQLGQQLVAGMDSRRESEPDLDKALIQLSRSLETGLTEGLQSVQLNPAVTVNLDSPPQVGDALMAFARIFEESIVPLVKTMDGKLDLDLKTQSEMSRVLKVIRELQERLLAG